MIHRFTRTASRLGVRRHCELSSGGVETLERRLFMHAGMFEVKVNFQPAASAVPAGYLVDAGAVFAARGNGQTYGWDTDNTANTRDRNHASSPDQRYDTLNHMQLNGVSRIWELEVPNGMYSVRVVGGDPQFPNTTLAIDVEGTLAVSGPLSTTTKWREGTVTVNVTDGRLTVGNAAGATGNKINFIDVHAVDSHPTISVSSADPNASEAGPDAATFTLTRAGDTSTALTVNFSLGGAATNGVDYQPLGSSVEFAAGSAVATVTVTPIDDADVEGAEGVTLTVLPDANYEPSQSAGSATVTINDNDGGPTQTPFLGVPFAVPAARIEAEDFDNGGQNVSYFDTTAGNTGNLYRTQTDVDIVATTDAGGGFHVGYVRPLEWLEYTIDVAQTGTYAANVRVASGSTGGKFRLEVDGVNKTGSMTVANTGGWQNWVTLTKSGVQLDAGRHVLRLFVETGPSSTTSGTCNFNWIQFVDQALPTVTVAATDAAAGETAAGQDANPGTVTITRTGPTTLPLTVRFSVTGMAANGTDYATITSAVTIDAGQSSAVVTVAPVDDALSEGGTESFVLTLTDDPAYVSGASRVARIEIADNDQSANPTLRWRTVANGPVGRSEAFGATVDGKFYLFGGYLDGTFKPTKMAHVYNPDTNTWARLADLPVGLTHAGAVVDGTGIIFAGGYPAGTTSNQTFSTNAVRRYDTLTNTYTSLKNLPAARGAGTLVLLGRELHFFGGSDAQLKDKAEHWALNLDVPGANWVVKRALPLARNHLGGAVVGNTLYALGGQTGQGSTAIPRNNVDVYDATTDTWSPGPTIPGGRAHISNGTIVRDGQIIVLGGDNPPQTATRSVYSFDPVAGLWKALTPLPAGRISGVADIIGDRILYTTGYAAGYNRQTWLGEFV